MGLLSTFCLKTRLLQAIANVRLFVRVRHLANPSTDEKKPCEDGIIVDETHTAESIKEVLHYIYLGRPSDTLSEHVVDVLDVAETLKLYSLKAEVYKILIHQVNGQNAGEMLFLAHRYKLVVLEEISKNLIVDNAEDTFDRDFIDKVDKEMLSEITRIAARRIRV